MEAVGIFLSSVIPVVIEKLLAPEIIKLTRQGDLHKAIQKLKTTLEDINDVLDDAEEKQLFNKAVNKWLKDLHHLAYDAEDLLDEFATEALRRKLEEEPEGSSSSKVRIRCLTPTCSSVLSPSTLRFNSEMRSKVEDINEKLQDVATKRTELGLVRKLVGEVSTNVGKRTPATSLMKESRIWGRDEDISRIIKSLLGDASTRNKVDVIPIVGMAGIGKTTLAQFVYNDEKVKDHFNLQGWVCVADESGFDVESITKAILESFTRKPCDLRGLNEVQVELKETLAGQKFLLVLDDVWNCRDENWSSLRPPFEAGAHGSKIIVTTRNREVVSCMPTAVEYPNLHTLSQDDCWKIFVQQAFLNRSISKRPELESIGKKIVNKCGGLPLAARALGGLLRCKEKEEEWQVVLNSNIWNLPYAKSGFLPAALILSYHHLPSHLKRCFQYCAIIPKDYEFKEEELVLLWMAEGLIKGPEGRKRMEDLGLEYFHELVSRSLFQMSSGNKSKFKMHDLINDLAQSVAGDVCFKLEDNLEGGRANKISNNARHSSYVVGRFDGIKRFEAFHDASRLRTFIQFPAPGFFYGQTTTSLFHDVLPKFKCLHSLRLRGFEMCELPHSIGDLKQLRYLNLSNGTIKRLPDSIGTLYNLEVLLLNNCFMEKLPRDMGNLVNLSHFDMTGSYFSPSTEMPFQIGKLTSLQTLSNFMVGKCRRQRIGELQDLSQVQGNMSISRLENVRNARDANEANLKSKQGLRKLSLEWNADHNPLIDRVDMDVLGMLTPHISLEQLTIKGYRSTTFPIWVGDAMFDKMESLRLENCKHCTSLPPFGQLPSLKELHIEGLSVLEHLGCEFYGKGCPKPFPLLERLSFVHMPEWNNWSNFGTEKGVQPYSQLRELIIGSCPKLVGGLPNDLPCLESLVIKNCPKLVGGLPNDLPRLKSLKIESCLQLQLVDASRNTPELGFLTLVHVSIPESLCDPSLPDSYVVLESAMSKHLGSVTELTIQEYGQLKFLPKWFIQGLLILEKLSITYGTKLVTLWHNEATPQHGLPTLRHLEVSNCPQLVSLFEEEEEVEEGEGMGWMPQQQQLRCVMRLENLDISSCPMLKKLPRGLHTLTSLAELRICSCSSLVSFPKTGLPPMLREIEIQQCNALQFLPELVTLNNLEVLYVFDCSSLTLLCSSGLPSALKRLTIAACKNLVSLVAEEGMEIYCPSLEIIEIRYCESLRTLPNAVHSSDGCSSLRNMWDLEICRCNSLMSIPKGWFHPSINMRQLIIDSCEAQLPPLGDHRQLTSLRKLNLRNCPARTFSCFINEVTGSYFLTSLTRLDIGGGLFPSPSEWGLHRLSSLEELYLCGPISMAGPGGTERDFKSFPEEEMLLPASLTTLSIYNFQNLEKLSFQNLYSLKSFFIEHCRRLRSFPKEGLPPSLLHLKIRFCPELASFPKQGLPLSLLSLNIDGCPRLKQRCEKHKGQYNIAYIPSKWI